jgi:hypothetical protein
MADKVELLLEADRRGILPPDQKALLDEARKRGLVGGAGPQQARPPMTLQERGKEVFGFKDYAERGTILPFGKTAEGEMEFATPEIFKGMAESALLPGHVAKGGSYTPQDALNFTLDYLVPGTSGRAPGTEMAPTTKKSFTQAAPSADDLKTQSRAFKAAANSSGVRVNPDSYTNLAAGLETEMGMNRLNAKLHPGSTGAFEELTKAVGQDLDLDDLQTLRRLIGQALRSTKPELEDDRRLAGIMMERLDDYVDNLSPDDVVAGDPSGVAENLKQFRSLWSRAKKSEIVEDIIERAKVQASGFENGVRIGFRGLLTKRGGTRGFTKDEIALMNQIAAGGTSGEKLMRLLGKLSFGTRGGSNFLGGSIGMAGGSALGAAVGGPLGAGIMATVPPAVGYVAAQGANRAAMNNALYARALAASGGKAPNVTGANHLSWLLEKGAGPLAGTAVQAPKARGQTIQMPDGSYVTLDPDVL